MEIEDIKKKVQEIRTKIPQATIQEALKVLELMILARRTK